MGRFSLSPPRLGGDQASLAHEMPYRENDYDSLDDDDDYDSQSFASDSSEEPHPLGFGITRFSLSPPSREFQSPSRFVFEDSDDEMMEDPAWGSTVDPVPAQSFEPVPAQSFPPLSSYISPCTAPTASLVTYSLRGQHDYGDGDYMEKLTQLLDAACILQHDAQHLLTPTTKSRSEEQDVGLQMWALSNSINQELLELKEQARKDRKHVEEENRTAAEALMILLKRDQEDAKKVLLREKKEEEKRQEAERLRQEQEAEEAAAQQKLIEKQQQQQEEDEKRVKQLEEDERRKQIAAKEAEIARRRKQEEAEAQKMEYASRAKRLVAKLVELRKTVEPFEKMRVPQVSKRRLNMKKTVRGKLNTLSHDAGKVQAIAAEVSSTISEARAQDEQIKQMIQSGAGGEFTTDMARGKRYLLDLLSSNVIVRIQAESFRGLKGDGFPLAAMLAEVSVEAKELVSILAAHIYTVCPMAIPTLPRPSPGSTEKELAASLGMGENETFERFLTRTEGTISMVADIMASKPPNHTLLGGHKGAVDWLDRFIALLPPAPDTPLPLLTAPVLDAFLTGAGDMLANKYPDQFKRHLDIITNDTIKRLDEGTIGQPSATRLKKLVSQGFDGFKHTLPEGAIPELYDGEEYAGSSGKATFSRSRSTSPFGASPALGAGDGFSVSSTANSNASPFGEAVPQSIPFGGRASTSSGPSNPNAFGQSQQANSNPPLSSAPSPFGVQPQKASQSAGQFGAPNEAMGSNDMNDMASTPFGSPNTSSFGSTPAPFGQSQTSNPNPLSSSAAGPFGAHSQNAPFGTPNANTASNDMTTTPFSSSNTASLGSASQSGSVFGTSGSGTAFGISSSNLSPFGAGGATSSSQPFGGGGATASSPFSVGANTQTFGSSGSASSGNAFGGGMSNTSAFGTSGQSFGGNRGAQSTPFGTTTLQQSQFGGGTQFGVSNSTASTFGGSNYGGGKQNSNAPPCRFFAKGNCRYGANCKYSHETGGGGGSSGFGGNNPFGGGVGTPTPFGASTGSNPFGGSRR